MPNSDPQDSNNFNDEPLKSDNLANSDSTHTDEISDEELDSIIDQQVPTSENADRFKDRVSYYVNYRPGYPEAIIPLLQDIYGLNEFSEVADIGAGVGHSVRLLLPVGCYIYAIEPSQVMYDHLTKLEQEHSTVAARLQSAENTSLDSKSVDFIVCGQSYHWFDKVKSKTEFLRILQPQGVVVLIWNSWKEDTEFGKAYTNLVKQHSIDYQDVSRTHDENKEKIEYLYSQGSYQLNTFEHSQYFDLEGLKGRYMSSSYAFLPDMEGHDAAMKALEQLFEEYQQDGTVEFSYTCEVYHGRIRH